MGPKTYLFALTAFVLIVLALFLTTTTLAKPEPFTALYFKDLRPSYLSPPTTTNFRYGVDNQELESKDYETRIYFNGVQVDGDKFSLLPGSAADFEKKIPIPDELYLKPLKISIKVGEGADKKEIFYWLWREQAKKEVELENVCWERL